ncbi:MAG: hypothetical protein PVF85_06415 [Anaerolineales bacterium]
MTTRQKGKRRPIGFDTRSKIFIVGALLAGALFLIEAGVSEIAIAVDQECREEVSSLRLAPDVFEICGPEWQWYLVRATSRGIPWVVNEDSAAIVGWLCMGLIYSLLGGLSAQFFRARGFIAFLLAQAGLIAALMGLGYFRQFIA